MERFKAQQRPEVTPAEAPVTAREEAAEPGGEERAENEAARERDTERSAGLEAAARPGAPAEAAAAGQRAKSGLVSELLPVVDNLERALASAGESEQHLAEGVRMVHSELLGVLQRNGVEQFDPSGEAFDPELHEALSTRSEDGAEPGVILHVVEKGYKLNGALLRAARVVVSG